VEVLGGSMEQLSHAVASPFTGLPRSELNAEQWNDGTNFHLSLPVTWR
jgi:hypothetical protein